MRESATELTWDRGPDRSRLTRLCLYAAVAPLLGAALGATLLCLSLLPALLSTPELLALVVLLALVGGPVSVLYLWPLLADPDQRPPGLRDSWLGGLDPVGAGVAAVAGLAALVGSLRLVAYGPLVVVGVCMVIGLPVAGLLSTRGRIDPERLTLQFEWARSRDGGLTIGMRNWTALRRVQFGPVAVCLASYAPGTAGGAPRLFVLPATVASDADAAFERALAASPETAAREGNPAVAATLAVFGVGTLALGVALWRLIALPPGIDLWLLAVCATFGGLFLALAAYER